MIFVTVGTHTLHFDRLILAAEAYAETTDEEVVIQSGSSQRQLRSARAYPFLSTSKMHELSSEARVIVMHAGVGSIMTALDAPGRLVLAPRRKKHNEHIDDHQLELASVLERRGIAACLLEITPETLRSAIELAPARAATSARDPALPAAIARRVNTALAALHRSASLERQP